MIHASPGTASGSVLAMKISHTFPDAAWDDGFYRLNHPDDFLLMVERVSQAGPLATANLINSGQITPESPMSFASCFASPS